MADYDAWHAVVLSEPFRPMSTDRKRDIYETTYILPTPHSTDIRSLLAENIKLREALMVKIKECEKLKAELASLTTNNCNTGSTQSSA